MTIEIYGANWCADCFRVKHFLDSKNISYNFKNIDTLPKFKERVLEYNLELKGQAFESIPVVVINGGEKVLIEPTTIELAEALEISIN